MSRIGLPAALAGTLVVALASPAARAEGSPAPGPAPAAPPAPGPAAPGAAPSTPAKDPRDQEIMDLRRIVEDAVRRIAELEKARQAAPAPAPAGEPPTAPPPPGGEPAAPPPPAPVPAGGRATLIPNISVTGNIILGGGDTERVPNRGRFNFSEFELALQDAVSPKMRYDIFLSAAKEEDWEVGLEEGFLTASALYPGLSARLGRIRTPFGKFNPLHPHSWVFITQPSVQGALLGPEGLNSDGAVLEYNLPVKALFAQLQFGWWQTTSETEDGLGFGAGEDGAYSARFWLGKEVGRDRELELGFSYYHGSGDVEPSDEEEGEAAALRPVSASSAKTVFGRFRKTLAGVDLTYRSYMSGGRRVILAAEAMNLTTRLPGNNQNAPGGFAYAAYRMNPFWEVGIRGDYTRFPYPVDSYDWGGSLYLTRYITEQTSLRLEYQYTSSPLLGTGSGIYFQILFGSGPHSHKLQ